MCFKLGKLTSYMETDACKLVSNLVTLSKTCQCAHWSTMYTYSRRLEMRFLMPGKAPISDPHK
jgi:hypothetical protein